MIEHVQLEPSAMVVAAGVVDEVGECALERVRLGEDVHFWIDGDIDVNAVEPVGDALDEAFEADLFEGGGGRAGLSARDQEQVLGRGG